VPVFALQSTQKLDWRRPRSSEMRSHGLTAWKLDSNIRI
jgi:hypothetical protein